VVRIRRDGFQIVIPFNEGQNFATVHFGQVQIQQSKVGARSIDVNPLAPQKSDGLRAVARHMQSNVPIDLVEGFLCQPDISGAVFN
jgi:hypothetical protein